ncbi:MAG: nucleotidyltransferase domain-containing protein [bacterium]|nr:nucleotidyltransferase domain-containing protein [bacterium]
MGTKYDINNIPVSHRDDIEKAVKILEEIGCREVYLFGSMVDGDITPGSDIDIAAKGFPAGSYFKVLARLMMQLDHPVDLVNLEKDNRFGNMLQREGYLHRVV